MSTLDDFPGVPGEKETTPVSSSNPPPPPPPGSPGAEEQPPPPPPPPTSPAARAGGPLGTDELDIPETNRKGVKAEKTVGPLHTEELPKPNHVDPKGETAIMPEFGTRQDALHIFSSNSQQPTPQQCSNPFGLFDEKSGSDPEGERRKQLGLSPKKSKGVSRIAGLKTVTMGREKRGNELESDDEIEIEADPRETLPNHQPNQKKPMSAY